MHCDNVHIAQDKLFAEATSVQHLLYLPWQAQGQLVKAETKLNSAP